jgi:hypothetical protein
MAYKTKKKLDKDSAKEKEKSDANVHRVLVATNSIGFSVNL